MLTCAHVVNAALRLPNSSKEKPEEIITLDFPLSGSNEKVTAKVGFWDNETDLAELQIIESLPSGVKPIYLHTPNELWDHRVQAFGFPSKNLEGTWADCQLRGHNTRGWVEVFDPNTTGSFIQQGFSGGPVWDSKLKCVVGIIVAVERNNESRVGYLIPTHIIAEKWKNLPVEKKKRKSTPSWMKRFTQKPKFQDVDLRNYPSVTCPRCGTIRSGDMDLPCRSCGARRTMFGYQYEHEYRTLLKSIVILLIVILLVIISGIILIIWLSPK